MGNWIYILRCDKSIYTIQHIDTIAWWWEGIPSWKKPFQKLLKVHFWRPGLTCSKNWPGKQKLKVSKTKLTTWNHQKSVEFQRVIIMTQVHTTERKWTNGVTQPCRKIGNETIISRKLCFVFLDWTMVSPDSSTEKPCKAPILKQLQKYLWHHSLSSIFTVSRWNNGSEVVLRLLSVDWNTDEDDYSDENKNYNDVHPCQTFTCIYFLCEHVVHSNITLNHGLTKEWCYQLQTTSTILPYVPCLKNGTRILYLITLANVDQF